MVRADLTYLSRGLKYAAGRIESVPKLLPRPQGSLEGDGGCHAFNGFRLLTWETFSLAPPRKVRKKGEKNPSLVALILFVPDVRNALRKEVVSFGSRYGSPIEV